MSFIHGKDSFPFESTYGKKAPVRLSSRLRALDEAALASLHMYAPCVPVLLTCGATTYVSTNTRIGHSRGSVLPAVCVKTTGWLWFRTSIKRFRRRCTMAGLAAEIS